MNRLLQTLVITALGASTLCALDAEATAGTLNREYAMQGDGYLGSAPYSMVGRVDFDLDGTVDGIFTEVTSGVRVDGSFTGTYEISSDGYTGHADITTATDSYTLSFVFYNGQKQILVQWLRDGATISGRAHNQGVVTTSLTGTYGVQAAGTIGLDTPVSLVGTLTLNSDGTVTGSLTEIINGVTNHGTFTGSYTIDSFGMGEATIFTDHEPGGAVELSDFHSVRFVTADDAKRAYLTSYEPAGITASGSVIKL